MMDATLLILCGLPGAGKSTLTRAFLARQSVAIGKPEGAVVYDCICFDDLYATSRQGAAFEPQDWKDAQRAMEARVRARIDQHRRERDDRTRLVLLIDDNFQYRSQRKRYFHIAREERCGFGIIYVKVLEAVCHARNAARAQALVVPEEPFGRMAMVFEAPDGAAFTHEANVAVLDNDLTRGYGDHSNTELSRTMAAAIHRLVEEAAREWREWEIARHAQESDRTQRARDADHTADNFVHQVDLALRRWMSAVLTGADSKLLQVDANRHEKATLAQHLNAYRKYSLDRLRGDDKLQAAEESVGQAVTRFQQDVAYRWHERQAPSPE